mgnify:CR=1 FL=1
MEIAIERFGSYHHAVSGRLLIDGQHVCDCIIVGECLHLGFLIHSEERYDLLIARIRMQFVRHHAVVVKISRSPDFLEVA